MPGTPRVNSFRAQRRLLCIDIVFVIRLAPSCSRQEALLFVVTRRSAAVIFSYRLIEAAADRLFLLCACSPPGEGCIQSAHSRCAVRPAPSFPGRPRAQDPSAEDMISVPP